MNKQQLAAKIWESANKMRSKIEANEYKDYILGFIFYKFLSEKEVKYLKANDWTDEYLPDLTEEDTETVESIQKNLGYFISYDNLFSTWLAKGSDFSVQDVRDALSAFSRLINPTHKKVFEGVFDTLQTGLSKLGDSASSQSKSISDLIQLIKDIPMDGKQGYDVLGFIYEYLIEKFAANAGKKAGEFYTPQAVSKILTKIAITGQEDKMGLSVYDPCCGSGSLLLNAKKYAKHTEHIKYYGQELMASTYNLARMNMFLHGVNPDNQKLRHGDTLDADWPTDEETDFNMVLMNPPYSAKWSAAKGFLQDERFSDYGVLAPKSKADYAFLLHGLYHLKSNGTMAIVLPHGVLFRGAAEGKIREKLLRSGNIYAVIGLPANLFYNTAIPTCIIVLKKHRDGRDVLFIDASKKFKKGKKQNEMEDEHINSILELYNKRETVDKESFLATFEVIEKNDFNLNIPRYVDNFEKEPDVDIDALLVDMKKTDEEIKQTETEFLSLLSELTSDDENIRKSLSNLIDSFKG